MHQKQSQKLCPNLSMKPFVSLKTGRMPMMTKEILFTKPRIVRTAVITNSSIFLVHSGLFGPLLSRMPWIVEVRQGSLFVIQELKYISLFDMLFRLPIKGDWNETLGCNCHKSIYKHKITISTLKHFYTRHWLMKSF